VSVLKINLEAFQYMNAL